MSMSIKFNVSFWECLLLKNTFCSCVSLQQNVPQNILNLHWIHKNAATHTHTRTSTAMHSLRRGGGRSGIMGEGGGRWGKVGEGGGRWGEGMWFFFSSKEHVLRSLQLRSLTNMHAFDMGFFPNLCRCFQTNFKSILKFLTCYLLEVTNMHVLQNVILE